MHRFRFAGLYIALVVLIADAISKYFTQAYLPLINYSSQHYPYGGIGVFKNFLGIEFSIVHAINRGAAWSIFAEWQEYLLYFRIILIVALLVYSLFYNTRQSWNIPLACIIAGAAGNVIDYFLYGHVIDMLHFVLWGYHYPTFNIADSAIFLGIVAIIFRSNRHS